MKNNKLENNIKDSFDAYQPPLNHDEIWDNIEPHLKKKKKRRFFFIWFLLAGLGLFMLSKTSISSFSTKLQSSESSVNKKAAKDLSITADELSPIIEKQINTVAKNSTKPENSPDTKTATKVLSVKTKKKGSLVPTNHSTLIAEPSTVASSSIPPLQISKAATSEENEAMLIEETPEIQDSKEVNQQSKENPKTKQAEGKETKEFNSKQDLKKEKKEKEKKKTKKKKITKPFKNNLRFFAQPTAGLIVPFKFLNSRNGFGESGYIQQRKETESQLEAFSIGFNLQAQTRKGFVMLTGIEYQRLNERFELFETREEQEVINGILTVTEDAEGAIINSTSGPKTVIRINSRKQRFYNHHEFITIPIGIGRYWHRPKYDLKLVGGLDFNLYHHFSGVLIGPDTENIDLRRKGNAQFDQIFKRKTGLGLWVSTEFHRPINGRLSWVIAPKFQIPLSTITKEDYRLKHKYYRLSFNLGLNFLIASQVEKKKKKS